MHVLVCPCSCLDSTFKIQRASSYYIRALVTPVVLLTLLSFGAPFFDVKVHTTSVKWVHMNVDPRCCKSGGREAWLRSDTASLDDVSWISRQCISHWFRTVPALISWRPPGDTDAQGGGDHCEWHVACVRRARLGFPAVQSIDQM